MRSWKFLPIVALAVTAACAETNSPTQYTGGPQFAKNNSGTINYTGQGFYNDGTTWLLNNERCGDVGQDAANDGGTGQFADWNGGQPYETGQAYLLWVLNGNNVTGAILHIGSVDYPMINVGGTWKVATPYYSRATLLGPPPAYATFTGGPANNLVVSHGCPGFTTEGAWCSPGYWRNADDFAWTQVDVDRTTSIFGTTVEPDLTDVTGQDAIDAAHSQLLQTILTSPQTYGGPNIASFMGFAGNAYNLTAAWLTNQIPGYEFDPSLVGVEGSCPLNHHGDLMTP